MKGLTRWGCGGGSPPPQILSFAWYGRLCRPYHAKRRYFGGLAALQTSRLAGNRVTRVNERRKAMYPTDSISTEQQIIDWMHTPAITQKLGASVDAALAVMREYNLQHLPIVLDTGELCGMLTQGDIRGAEILRFAGLDPQMIADALK